MGIGHFPTCYRCGGRLAGSSWARRLCIDCALDATHHPKTQETDK